MKIFSLLSPTWALADFLKCRYNRTKTIKTLNSLYLGISAFGTIFIVVAEYLDNELICKGLYKSLPFFGVFFCFLFLMSRNNEIFWAFLKDAFDKMESDVDKNKNPERGNNSPPPSGLTPRDRIILSLKSYLELILNFSILYALIDRSLWKSDLSLSMTDFIYYSGVTITTTGYGDLTPTHWLPQFLSVYEVFCGVILLVVCFAVYAGRLDKNNKSESGSQDKPA